MKFGLGYGNTVPFTDPGLARDLAQGCEDVGFDSIWTVEHVIWPEQYDSTYPYHPSGKMPGNSSIPIPDPLVWLTWIAAATKSIRLGTGVVILPQRNALVLAKEAATLDHLSGGRVELGIGVGWLREEFEALGMPFEGRGRVADEMIGAMRTLWREDVAAFQGEAVAFSNVAMNPKPVNGSIPIVIGGHSRRAARRAAELGDGFYPGPGSVDGARLAMEHLHTECEAAGRDPGEIEVSMVFPGKFMADPASAIETMLGLGVDRIIVPVYEVSRPDLDSGLAAFRDAIG